MRLGLPVMVGGLRAGESQRQKRIVVLGRA